MIELSFENVHKRFPGKQGDQPVLKGFSWSARSGEIVGLVGPNGAGKTTCLHILMGFLSPDAGDVLISTPSQARVSPTSSSDSSSSESSEASSSDGDVSSSSPTARKPLDQASALSLVRSPAFAFQSWCALLPEHPLLKKRFSGKDLLIEYALMDGLDKTEALRKLDEVKKWLPVEHFWDKPSLRYSRGQSGLISLGRVMMIERPILLLDEPTVGLDFEATKKVHAWMRHQASEGKVVVISTHLLNDLHQLTTDIVGLDKGVRVSDDVLHQWMTHWH